MKLPHLHRTAPDPDPDPDHGADATPAAASTLGLDDWHGNWPVDDTPPAEGQGSEVPMLMNPGRPTIGPS